MSLLAQIPASWQPALAPALSDPSAQSLAAFLNAERAGIVPGGNAMARAEQVGEEQDEVAQTEGTTA